LRLLAWAWLWGEKYLGSVACVTCCAHAHYFALNDKQIKALPPRWCLMRNKHLTKAGWVMQQYIEPDHVEHEAAAEFGGPDAAAITEAVKLGDKVYAGKG